MRMEDVRELVRRQRFRPFRITLTDGRTYDVHHPELAMVGRGTVAIGLPRPGDPEPVDGRLVTVSLIHILQIDPIEEPASPGPAAPRE
jgi:hypothetical protein